MLRIFVIVHFLCAHLPSHAQELPKREPPPPGFPNHVILSVGGTLYDPSYGTGPFPDHAAWEKASLFGVGTFIADAEGKPIHRGEVRTEGRLSSTTRMLDPD